MTTSDYVRPLDLDTSLEVHRHRWLPPDGVTPNGRSIYLLHGTGEHAGRYSRLATRLAAAGWSVGAHDHYGHGRSGGLRGRIPVPGTYATRAAIEFAAFERETGSRPFLFGHSLGGVVAAELVLTHRLPVAGLLLSAPAIVPRLSRTNALKLRLYSALIPRHAVEQPYDPSRLTHDEEQQALALNDPLNHGFKSAEFVSWLMAAAERLVSASATLDVETLLMIAADDVVIDIERTRQFAAAAPRKLLTTRTYEQCHHELLNEAPAVRERIEADILEWLDARIVS